MYMWIHHISICGADCPNNDITRLSIDWWTYHSCHLRKRYCHMSSQKALLPHVISESATATLSLSTCISDVSMCGANRPDNDMTRLYIDRWVYHSCDRKRYCHCISVCVYILHVYLRRRPPEWWRYGQMCRLMRMSLMSCVYHWCHLLRRCHCIAVYLYRWNVCIHVFSVWHNMMFWNEGTYRMSRVCLVWNVWSNVFSVSHIIMFWNEVTYRMSPVCLMWNVCIHVFKVSHNMMFWNEGTYRMSVCGAALAGRCRAL